MDRVGILDLFGLAATLLFAIPIGVFGVQLLLGDHPVFGLVGILVAVGLILAERYLWSPESLLDGPAGRVVSWIVRDPPEER